MSPMRRVVAAHGLVRAGLNGEVVRIGRFSRSMLAAVLVMLLSAPASIAQPSSADKVYRELLKIPLHSEIEVQLIAGTRLRGTLLGYDRRELSMSGQTAPLPLVAS